MITTVDREHVARALLTYLAEPGDPVLAAWLEVTTPADAVAAISAGRLPELPAMGSGSLGDLQAEKVAHAYGIWRQRLGDHPGQLDLDQFRREGIRLVCPGDSEWPTQLDTLGVGRPYALWLRGEADLRYCCLQSVSIVGARASSAYGEHVGTEMAAALAERGWTVVSGGAYGIDGCAHRGALAADGVTIAVLACGVDHAYPPGHHDLLTSIAAQGVLVSEWPPGCTPNKLRFLIRNRVIGALTRGTVVVEAGLRSGALNTARHAQDLRRPVMAVPGPVTSEVSAGCHKIIREWGAVCVTNAHDVIDLLTPLCDVPAYGSAAPAPAPVPAYGSAAPDPAYGSAVTDPAAAGPRSGAPDGTLKPPASLPAPLASVPASPTSAPLRPDPNSFTPARRPASRFSPTTSAYGPAAPVSDPVLAYSSAAPGRHPSTPGYGSAAPSHRTAADEPSAVATVHPLRPSLATAAPTPGLSPRPADTAGPPRLIASRERREALLSRDALSPATRTVLDAIPARGAGPAVIAVRAGLDVDAAVSALGLLAASGFVERCTRGWRIRRLGPGG
jgi:DNA processing protein